MSKNNIYCLFSYLMMDISWGSSWVKQARAGNLSTISKEKI
jgi:hypothetical protein